MFCLVNINYSEDHSEKILPMGILSIGSALKKADIPVELISITEKEIDDTVKQIVDMNPACVGVSVMTGIQTQHSAELSRKIKAQSDIPIIWGGIHPSLCSDQCLSEDYIDFIAIGEAEETAIEFASRLTDGGSFDGVLGLGYKTNGETVIEPKRPLIENLDDWRFDFSLLDMNKFVYKLGIHERVVAFKSSRGCPFTCSFCYNEEFNLRRWRTWSIDSVVEDVNYLKENYNIDAVKFYDDNFIVNKKRTIELLEKIGIPAHVEVRIDTINEEMAEALRKYRCFDLLIGIESGSDRLLQMIQKNLNVEKMLRSIKYLADNKLPVTYSTIVGLPTETKEEFNSTLDLMYKIYQIHPEARFTMGAYLPYPGSPMYHMAQLEGFKPPESTEEWGRI